MRKMLMIAGLVGLNAALGTALYMRTNLTPPAYGQRAGGAVDLMTVTGNGMNGAVIYALDANTGRLAAIKLDPNTKVYTGVAAAQTAADLARIK